MIKAFYDKASTTSINSQAILLLASGCKQARVKRINDEKSDEQVYAIGFGCISNSCLLIGGATQKDWLPTSILIAFTDLLCNACNNNGLLLGIRINKLFEERGVWIIPNMAHLKSNENHLIGKFCNEIKPNKLIELNQFGEKLKYYFGTKTPPNSRLFAYLLASSCGYNIDRSKEIDIDGYCNWFVNEYSKPAYSFFIGRECELSAADIEPILARLLEAIIISIAA